MLPVVDTEPAIGSTTRVTEAEGNMKASTTVSARPVTRLSETDNELVKQKAEALKVEPHDVRDSTERELLATQLSQMDAPPWI